MELYFLISKILSPFFLFSNLLILILIILFLLKKRLIKTFNYYFIFFIILSLYPFGDFFDHHLLRKEFYNKENLNNVDAIIVLGGDERRIIYAINELKNHKNAKLIFSGGSGYLVQSKQNNENNSFQKLTSNILNSEDFYVLKNSRNTIENLINFKEFNIDNKFKKVVVLTSPAHMKRTMIISKKIGLNLYPHYWDKQKKEFSLLNYFQNFNFLNNINSFDNLFREILGIMVLKFMNFEN